MVTKNTSYHPLTGDSETAYFNRRGSFLNGGHVQVLRDVILHTDGLWYQYISAIPTSGVSVAPGSSPDSNWKAVGNGSWYDMPDSAALIKYKGMDEKTILDMLSSVKISPLTDFGMYSAWPQGKVFSHKNKAYCLYNVGASHSSAPLSVYQQISDDGVSWTRPAPRVTNTDATTWPQGVSAWGAGSDGTSIWVAARFRRVSDESQSKCVLYKSTNDGATYTPVLDPMPLVDENGWCPVLYHSFAVLPNGNIAFGYHLYTGEVGIARFDGSTGAYLGKSVMFTSAQMGGSTLLCESTLQVYGNRVVGFLRSQNPATKAPQMWYSDDNCLTFTFKDLTGVPGSSPISLTSYQGKTYVFYCGRYRNGNSNSALTNSPILTMRIGTDADARELKWENFAEIPVAAVPSIYNDVGASGTGVQDVTVRGSKIICCLSSNVGGNLDQADVYSVTIDLGSHRNNGFFKTEESFTNSRRATDYPGNYHYGDFNVVDMGGRPASYRLNGMVVVQDQADATRFGSTTGAASKLHAFNNGPMPAYLSAEASSTNVTLWSSSGILELRAGSALVNANVTLNVTTGEIKLRNKNNNGGMGVLENGHMQFSANWQHCMLLTRGSGGDVYLWVSGTNNMMRKTGSPPTSDSDGIVWSAAPTSRTGTLAALGAGAYVNESAYVTNGLKAGEIAGAGTGVSAYWNGTAWTTYSADAAVAV